MKPLRVFLIGSALGSSLVGCAGVPAPKTPLTLVRHVEIPRFMGDWFVIAGIPTWLERGAHNPRESYRLDEDGTVATTFSFNAGSSDGPMKTYRSKGIVVDTASNAVWAQQYVWPFKADYRIAYLSDDYRHVVVARDKRDYVWIMSRSPTMADADLARLTEFVRSQGYDTEKLERMPQAHGEVAPEPSTIKR